MATVNNTSPIYVPQCDSPIEEEYFDLLNYLETPIGAYKTLLQPDTTSNMFVNDNNNNNNGNGTMNCETDLPLIDETQFDFEDELGSAADSPAHSESDVSYTPTTTNASKTSKTTKNNNQTRKTTNTRSASASNTNSSQVNSTKAYDPTRNARMAKENRERKKAYLQKVENELEKSQAHVQSLTSECEDLRKQMQTKDQRIQYLEAILAQQSTLSKFFASVESTGALFTENPNCRKRLADDDRVTNAAKSRKSQSKMTDAAVVPVFGG